MLNGPRVGLWKDRQHDAIASLALRVIGSADETIAIIRGEPASPRPPSPAHLRLYRDHRRALRVIEDLAMEPDEPADPEAAVFLIRVALRCAHAYLRTPGDLFRAARNGDLEALEQLLRLDKAAIFEPRIASHLAAIFGGAPRRLKQRMATALVEDPIPPKLKALKARMAAYVIAIAEEDETFAKVGARPPSPRDLRDLFDAIAMDTDGRQLRDTDLPPGEDAWRNSVRRADAKVRPLVRAAVAYPGWTKLAP